MTGDFEGFPYYDGENDNDYHVCDNDNNYYHVCDNDNNYYHVRDNENNYLHVRDSKNNYDENLNYNLRWVPASHQPLPKRNCLKYSSDTSCYCLFGNDSLQQIYF